MKINPHNIEISLTDEEKRILAQVGELLDDLADHIDEDTTCCGHTNTELASTRELIWDLFGQSKRVEE